MIERNRASCTRGATELTCDARRLCAVCPYGGVWADHGERQPAGAARATSYLNALTKASKTPGIQYVVVNATDVVFELRQWVGEHPPPGARRHGHDHDGVLDEQDDYRGRRAATRRGRESGARRSSGTVRRFVAVRCECHRPPAHLAYFGHSEPDSLAMGASGGASRELRRERRACQRPARSSAPIVRARNQVRVLEHRLLAAPSPSSEVDADPAAQPSTTQRVRRKPRSRENRCLLPGASWCD